MTKTRLIIIPQIKAAIKCNTHIYSKHGWRPEERAKVIEIQNQTSKLITDAKNTYSKKLGNLLFDSSTGEKNF